MKVIADLCVIPLGVGLSVSKEIALCERILTEAGLKTRLHAYGTNIEGEWDTVFAAVRRCHEALHAAGVPRISANIRFGTRTDRDQTMEDKVASVEQKQGLALPGFPEELERTIRSFQESRVLLSALELNMFTAVEGGVTVREAAQRLKADARATEMLLNALVSLGCLQRAGETYQNTEISRRFFTDDSAESSRQAFLHTANLWHRWSTLSECVRTGTRVAPGTPPGPEFTEPFIAAMHRNAAVRAPELLRVAGTEGVRRMLDLGGGSGAYSIAFARAAPDLQADILDQPEVLAIAQRHIDDAGLAGRVRTKSGDIHSTPFGEGYDLVLASAICHIFSEEENRALCRKAYAALAPGGRFIIADFVLEPDKTAPRQAALFSLNMLVGTEHGASYSGPEYFEWLAAAGFTDIRHLALSGPASIVLGRR